MEDVPFPVTRDPAAREQFILAHMGLVVTIARRYLTADRSLCDLVQEGAIGLIHAVDRFDPSQGTRFASYAAPWIIGSILRALEHEPGLRIPYRVQRTMRAYRAAEEQLRQTLGRAPTEAEVAHTLRWPAQKMQQVQHLLHLRVDFLPMNET